MKKFIPYILMLTILAGTLAPFSVALKSDGNVGVQRNEVFAEDLYYYNNFFKTPSKQGPFKTVEDCKKASGNNPCFIESTTGGTKNNTSTDINSINFGNDTKLSIKSDIGSIKVTILEKDSNYSSFDFYLLENNVSVATQTINYTNIDITKFKNYVEFLKLKENTEYILKVSAFDNASGSSAVVQETLYNVKTSDTQEEQIVLVNTSATVGGVKVENKNIFLPRCHPLNGIGPGEGTFAGCFVQLLYWGVFQPTSFVFGLAGKFFDWAFAYSISDTSYRTAFVTEGWGIVRDICNLFFIFVLIYAAFGMILGVHSIKAKEIVVNTIIIGLLINFSLFASQVLIDTSNILARVFYNSEAVKIATKDNNASKISTWGVVSNGNTSQGELSISAALIGKVNPQRIILESYEKLTLKDEVNGQTTTISSTDDLGAGAWFLVILMASAVNIVGIIVFLSVGLIFIARVIGLWFAMIFVPLAFFSYTVPQMQTIAMVGWKKWWPETLGLCFVAPIFMFFMYLVLLFLQTGFVGLIAESDGPNWVLSIIIPFIFIMMLLILAKKLAKQYSGQMGQMITGAVTAVGAAALGGAALSAAFIGRSTMGRITSMSSQGRTATQKYEAAKEHERATGDSSMLNNLKWHQKLRGAIGSTVGLGALYGKTDGTYDITTHQKNMDIKSGLGGILNRKQEHVEHIDHDRHTIDAVKDKRYKDVPINKLSGTQIKNVREDYIKENRGRFAGEEDDKYRQAHGLTKNDALTAAQVAEVQKLTDARAATEFNTKLASAAKTVDGFTRAFTRSNTGTYDVRNLSQTKADKREGIFTKIGAATIAGIALGVRTGLKGVDINHGSGQNDFLKDLGHTITEAMKSTKFNVKVEESHGKGGGDAHNASGGGH